MYMHAKKKKKKKKKKSKYTKRFKSDSDFHNLITDGRTCRLYEGRAKGSVTNRLPLFILKCFTTLEWCVE